MEDGGKRAYREAKGKYKRIIEGKGGKRVRNGKGS